MKNKEYKTQIFEKFGIREIKMEALGDRALGRRK